MRSFAVILAISCLFMTSISAQNLFGVKAGICWTNIKNPHDSLITRPAESRYITGAQVGFWYEIKLKDFLSIQPEFQYLQKGGTYSGFFADTVLINKEFFSTQITIPIMLKLKLDNGDYGWFANAGPYFTYNFDKGIQTTKIEPNGDFSFIDHPKSEYPTTEWGIQAGFGAYLRFKKGFVVLDARFDTGLTDIDLKTDGSATRNNGFLLSVGYCFQFHNYKKADSPKS